VSTAAHLELPDPTGAIPPKQPAVRVESGREGPRARRVREAVEAVGNAALGIARRVEAIDAAQESLDGLRVDLHEAMRDLTGVVLDLTRPQPQPRQAAQTRPRSTGGGIPKVAGAPRPGTLARAVWDLLPGTAVRLSESSGIELGQLKKTLDNLRAAGRCFYSDEHGNLTRRDPRQPELPGMRALDGGKGVEHDEETGEVIGG